MSGQFAFIFGKAGKGRAEKDTAMSPKRKERCALNGYLMNNDNAQIIVMQIHSMNIEGNIVPNSWLKHIRKQIQPSMDENKSYNKPNAAACLILADIIYWYRPIRVEDEKTGKFLRYQKKFAADMLQKSYKSLANKFGLSTWQAKECVDLLCELGVVRREFRTINVGNGTKLNNVMFLEPVPEKVSKITYDESSETFQPVQENDTPPPEFLTTLPQNSSPPSPRIPQEPGEEFRDTNTEITTKTTTRERAAANSKSSENSLSPFPDGVPLHETVTDSTDLVDIVNESFRRKWGRKWLSCEVMKERKVLEEIFRVQCQGKKKVFALMFEESFRRWDTLSCLHYARKKEQPIARHPNMNYLQKNAQAFFDETVGKVVENARLDKPETREASCGSSS